MISIICASSQMIQSPAEIVWLNGAPGSGKGANTPYILESRGLSRSVTMCAPGFRVKTLKTYNIAKAAVTAAVRAVSEALMPLLKRRQLPPRGSIARSSVPAG